MKHLFLIIAAMLSVSARAELDFTTTHAFAEAQLFTDDDIGTSRFAQLMERYDASVMPSPINMRGWWTGRCYDAKTPNKTESRLLVVREAAVLISPGDNSDNGPMFPPIPPSYDRFNAMIQVISNQTPDPGNLFDDPSPHFMQAISNFLDSTDMRKYRGYPINQAFEVRFDDGNLQYSARQYGSYYIVKNTILTDTSSHKAGDIAVNCYYFKKVHE
jgi:hypothetical protein